MFTISYFFVCPHYGHLGPGEYGIWCQVTDTPLFQQLWCTWTKHAGLDFSRWKERCKMMQVTQSITCRNTGFLSHGGTQKWLVYNMENPVKNSSNGWFGGTPILGNSNIWLCTISVAYCCPYQETHRIFKKYSWVDCKLRCLHNPKQLRRTRFALQWWPEISPYCDSWLRLKHPSSLNSTVFELENHHFKWEIIYYVDS